MHKHLNAPYRKAWMRRTLLVPAVIAAVATAAGPATGVGPLKFKTSKRTNETVAYDVNTVKVILRRSGVPADPGNPCESLGTPIPSCDDTVPVTADGFTHHVAGFKTFDLRVLGVPEDAVMVDLGVRAVMTKGNNNYGSSIWLHARAPGSTCCVGPDGFANMPLDGAWGGQPKQDGMLAQTVANLPNDGRRDTSSWPVRVQGGKLQLSWGYRRQPGLFPDGDAVALVVYLNGWTR